MFKWSDLFSYKERVAHRETAPRALFSVNTYFDSVVTYYKEEHPSLTEAYVEISVSVDGQATWLPFVRVESGDPLPYLTKFQPLEDVYVKIRATLKSKQLHHPEAWALINNVRVEITTAKTTHAELEYDVIDLRDWIFRELDVTSVPESTLPGNTSLELYYSMDGDEWGSPTTPLDKGRVLIHPAYNYAKPVLTLTSTENNDVPVVTGSLSFTSTATWVKGSWTTPVLDVSDTVDNASGEIRISADETQGMYNVFSRSCDTSNGEFTSWYRASSSGDLTHPPNNFVQVMVILMGNVITITSIDVFYDGVSKAIPLTRGLYYDTSMTFTMLNDKVIMSNGVDVMCTWDGEEPFPKDVAEVLPLRCLTTHQNRVWGVDREVSSRLRFSNILDPETWDTFDFLDFNPFDGDKIMALTRFGQDLVIAKERSMAVLTGDRKSNYAVVWLDFEKGIVGENAMCITDKYLCYVSRDGVRFSDLLTSGVATERLRPDWDNINHKALSGAAITSWRNCLYVALPSAGSKVNDQVWCYDFLLDSWAIYTGWKVSNWLPFHQFGEEILLAGDAEKGQIYTSFEGTLDDGEKVSYEWQSKSFDFNVPEKYKLFRNVFMDITGTDTESPLEVDLIVDGEVKGTYKTTIPEGIGKRHNRRVLPPLYEAVLGSDFSVRVRTKCGIQSITIDYVVRGNIPGGDI